MSSEVAAQELLSVELNGHATARWSLPDYQAELVNPLSKRYFLRGPDADTAGEPLAGFVFYRLHETEAWVLQLAVRQKNRGFGTLLMRGFMEQVKSQRAQSIGLEVAINNVAALKLYAKFGFVKIGERKNYYRNGDSALVMKCALK